MTELVPKERRLSIERLLRSRFGAVVLCHECQNPLVVRLDEANEALPFLASKEHGDEGGAHLKFTHCDVVTFRAAGRKPKTSCSVYNAERVSFLHHAHLAGNPSVRLAVMQALSKPDVRAFNRHVFAALYREAAEEWPSPDDHDRYEDASLVAFGGFAPLIQHPWLAPYLAMSLGVTFGREGGTRTISIGYREHEEDFLLYPNDKKGIHILEIPAYLILERQTEGGWSPMKGARPFPVSLEASRVLLSGGITPPTP